METTAIKESQKRVICLINHNELTQEQVQAMGLGRCNIGCMRKAGNKDINNSKYVAHM